jgi:hypothetical protein
MCKCSHQCWPIIDFFHNHHVGFFLCCLGYQYLKSNNHQLCKKVGDQMINYGLGRWLRLGFCVVRNGYFVLNRSHGDVSFNWEMCCDCGFLKLMNMLCNFMFCVCFLT